jgi:hypothetical protein
MLKKLLNPFAYFNDKILFGIGISFHFIVALIAKLTNSFFPDFLSIKKNGIEYSYIDLLYQNTRNVAIAIIILFILGKIINKKTRLIDIINVVLISRIAYYFIFITDFIPIVNESMEKVLQGLKSNLPNVLQDPTTMTVVLIVAFLALLLLATMFYYLYIGFKTVTNLKTYKETFLFIITVIFIVIVTSLLSLFTPLELGIV